MRQEDNFNKDLLLEVDVYLKRKSLFRYISPVRIVRIPLLIDMYCWLIMTKQSGIDFTAVDQLQPDEYLSWLMYAAYTSHQAAIGKRPRVSIIQAAAWTKGLLSDDRNKIFELIVESRTVGDNAAEYRDAMTGETEETEGDDEVKKASRSVQGS